MRQPRRRSCMDALQLAMKPESSQRKPRILAARPLRTAQSHGELALSGRADNCSEDGPYADGANARGSWVGWRQFTGTLRSGVTRAIFEPGSSGNRGHSRGQ
jgi:hypothetical protein